MPRNLARLVAITAAVALLALPAAAQDADYADFVPDTTLSTYGDGPPDTALVVRLFTLAFTEECSQAIDGGIGGIGPETWDIAYREYWDEPDDPARAYRLYQFTCNAGAYNVGSVFYGWSDSMGLQPLSFAVAHAIPQYDETEDDATDAPLIGLDMQGIGSRTRLTNAQFDPATETITATAYWRGIGDAAETGVWAFGTGEFVLVRYDVDASYDGEINPETVLEYRTD